MQTLINLYCFFCSPTGGAPSLSAHNVHTYRLVRFVWFVLAFWRIAARKVCERRRRRRRELEKWQKGVKALLNTAVIEWLKSFLASAVMKKFTVLLMYCQLDNGVWFQRGSECALNMQSFTVAVMGCHCWEYTVSNTMPQAVASVK